MNSYREEKRLAEREGRFLKPHSFPQMLLRQVLESKDRPVRFHVAVYDVETQKKIAVVPFYAIPSNVAIEIAIEREPLSDEEFQALNVEEQE